MPRAQPEALIARGARCWSDLASGASAFGIVLVVWTLAPLYNMVMVALESHDDVFTDAILPPHPSLAQLLDRGHRGLLVPRVFLAPVRQQPLCRRAVTFPHAADRLAGQLLDRPDAHPQRLAGQQRGAADLCDPGLVPGDPVLPDHAELRAGEQSVVGDRRRGHLRDTLCDLHLLSNTAASIPIELDESARIDGASPLQIYFAHLSADDGAGAGRGRHLRAAAGVERISVPVPAAVVEAEHDGAGGAGAVPEQRRGAVELHDGDGDRLCAAAASRSITRSAAA